MREQIVDQHGGEFPRSVEQLAQLPGIGRSTAAAIAALAFGERAAILDGNVRRVLARHCGIEGYPGSSKIERVFWQRAESLLPVDEIETYTQGLMDLGATVCTRSRPNCACVSCQRHVCRTQRADDRQAADSTTGTRTRGASSDRAGDTGRGRGSIAGAAPAFGNLGRTIEPAGVRTPKRVMRQ